MIFHEMLFFWFRSVGLSADRLALRLRDGKDWYKMLFSTKLFSFKLYTVWKHSNRYFISTFCRTLQNISNGQFSRYLVFENWKTPQNIWKFDRGRQFITFFHFGHMYKGPASSSAPLTVTLNLLVHFDQNLAIKKRWSSSISEVRLLCQFYFQCPFIEVLTYNISAYSGLSVEAERFWRLSLGSGQKLLPCSMHRSMALWELSDSQQ